MTLVATSTPDTDLSLSVDTLLLVTSGEAGAVGEVSADLVRRLNADGRISVQPFRLGADAHARLTEVVEGAPERVVAVPLSASLQDSLPTELAGLLKWAAAWWPELPFIQAAPLGTPGYLVDWASRRIRAALEVQTERVPRGRTGVLVVGPAGAPPAANAEICAMARLVWEDGDYGLVETAFVHDGRRPSVKELMARCEQAGMRCLVVLPFTLLDGAMVATVRSLAAQYPRAAGGMEVVVAGPLLESATAAAVISERYHDARVRWKVGSERGGSTAPDSLAAAPTGAAHAAANILPPRYRSGSMASSSPMRSAPLNYDDDGRVAWDTIWQSFCDLALAGGPPHRGTLLEPASKEEVFLERADYDRVAAEIARGLTMITGFPVIVDAAPGWVGLVCPEEEMAVWMLRAIIVENVSVRRQGATLFLPAGPDYRVEKEIKNVITSVAKTHHYWTEHLNAT